MSARRRHRARSIRRRNRFVIAHENIIDAHNVIRAYIIIHDSGEEKVSPRVNNIYKLFLALARRTQYTPISPSFLQCIMRGDESIFRQFIA